uniref:Uncharacterized protein n=2 Tax=Ovis aries TaxID=9940 RepID=A0AC11E0E1_SHEEP
MGSSETRRLARWMRSEFPTHLSVQRQKQAAEQELLGTAVTVNPEREYIMRNTGLEEAQTGIKTARRNINNLRYADDTTLMAESEEELKSLLMKVKEKSEKVDLSSTFRKQRSWHPVASLHGK